MLAEGCVPATEPENVDLSSMFAHKSSSRKKGLITSVEKYSMR